LTFLRECGWLQAYPELAALIGCPQNPKWHPEGDVWTHTLLVTDEAAKIAMRDRLNTHDRATLVLAALCHDVGKPETTEVCADRVRSPGHAGATETFRHFLDRIGAPASIVERVIALCIHHLAHIDFTDSARHVRRLAWSLSRGGETVEMLARLVEADSSGRPPLPKGLPERMTRLLGLARQLQAADTSPRPLLLGRHLLALGFKPGPYMGDMLRAAYEAQLDGEFTQLEAAYEWVRRTYAIGLLSSPPP
jgi:tRNA nucleotidyltransferase (CCA-adding enzyme)